MQENNKKLKWQMLAAWWKLTLKLKMAKRTIPLSLILHNHKPWAGSDSKLLVYLPFKLNSSRIVYLEEISIGATYSSLVYGKPDISINIRIVENLRIKT